MSRRRAIVLVGLLALAIGGCGGSGEGAGSGVGDGRDGLTSAQVVQRFARAGLEAARPRSLAPNEFGVAPRLTDDATRFFIPSLGRDNGGRAFVFDDVDDLRETKQVYDDLGEESGLLFSWTFANEDRGVLVQINGELPERRGDRYRRVVAEL